MNETTFQFTTAATDPEVQHIDVAVQLFEKLDAAEQGRMLAYLNARYPDFLGGLAKPSTGDGGILPCGSGGLA